MEGQLYLPELCGNTSDGGLFWDWSALLDTPTPSLTVCFQYSVWVWWPCILFWIAAPCYVLYCQQQGVSKPRALKLNCLCRTKIVLCAATCLLCVIDSGKRIYETECDICTGLQGVYTYVTSYVQAVTFASLCILTNYLYRKRIHSSGFLFLFWLTLSLTGLVSLTSDLLRPEYKMYEADFFTFVTSSIYYALIFVQFVLTLIPDTTRNADIPILLEDDDETAPVLHSSSSSLMSWSGQHYPISYKAPCPEETATFLSKITFFWQTGLLIRGFLKKTLTFDDLYDINAENKCVQIVPEIQTNWEGYTKKQKVCSGRHLLLALLWTVKGSLLTTAALRFIICFTSFFNPLLLQVLITWLASKDPYRWKGYAICALLLVANLFNSVVTHLFFKFAAVTAMRVRTAVTAMVYRKAMRLSVPSRQHMTVGSIVNLMSVDAQKVQDTINDMHEVWAAPIMVAIALYYLWTLLGPSCLAGLAFIILLVPINGGFLVRKFAGLQEVQMKYKDERIRMVTEIVSSIKVLKMYAWECVFRSRVGDVREKELYTTRVQAYIQASVGMIWYCTPFLVSLCVFTVYILSSPDNFLDPEKAFVSVNLFNTLNWSTCFIPIFLALAAQSYISLQRICKLLLMDEMDDDAVDRRSTPGPAVEIEGGSFVWSGNSSDKPTLSNINLRFKSGELTAIVGQVGCGKSSLVSAMLGEIPKIQGHVKVKGSVSYVPQEAWIQNMSVKKNILFGRSLDHNRYNSVLSACALLDDLTQLPFGDKTEIGEKGINLSGGQRQRISLARAVYQRCDIVIMDDTLSAVDAHVGRHIFDNVLGPQGVLKHKTRILVTHNLSLLSNVDRIIVLDDGCVAESGTYRDLVNKHGIFTKLLGESAALNNPGDKLSDQDSAVSSSSNPEDIPTPQGSAESSPKRRSSHTRRRRTLSHKRQELVASGEGAFTSRTNSNSKTAERLRTPQIIEDEEAGEGTIRWSVLRAYMEAGGVAAFVCVILFELVYVASLTMTNIWLSAWSDDTFADAESAREQTLYRLEIYAVLGIGQMLSVGVLSLSVYMGCLRASSLLHSTLLERMLRAPLRFFHSTPVGRIINRFSTDIDKLDSNIPTFTRLWLFNVAAVLSTIVIITYSTVVFLVVAIPLIIIYVIIQRIYIVSIRQLKRIDSVRRSPLYVHFNESLVGVTCVRAYEREVDFIMDCDRLIDNSNIAWYPILIGQRLLGFFLDFLGSLVVFFAALFAILQPSDNTSIGIAALAVSFAMQISWAINMMVRGSSELETHVVSVERIVEYTKLPQEPAWISDGNRPPVMWPHCGMVEFKQYSARYRPGLDPALKGISLKISPGEKLAVVGRTGAGKSSMAMCLFRLLESVGGALCIDDLNVATIGLHDLRSKITVIPQEPCIFMGSLRWNLDPHQSYSSAEIWKALEQVHLKGFVSELPEKLDFDCGEGGQNLSLGQRQLVCLARALLRRSKVLVLDEVTASVDPETDALIQTMLRTHLGDCTVITIAHRISTIRDYDRVCVMHDGRILELDTPTNLMKDEKSLFKKLAEEKSTAHGAG